MVINAAAVVWALAACSGEGSIDPKDAQLVASGARVYAQHCASCHGANLEGQPNWKDRLPNGRLPAPPHDASRHTCHHADEVLFDITRSRRRSPRPTARSDAVVLPVRRMPVVAVGAMHEQVHERAGEQDGVRQELAQVRAVLEHEVGRGAQREGGDAPAGDGIHGTSRRVADSTLGLRIPPDLRGSNRPGRGR
jgi:hypothetical protein